MGCCNSNPIEDEEVKKNMKLGIKLKTYMTERAIEVWQLPPPSPIEFSPDDFEISNCNDLSWASFRGPGIFFIGNIKLWLITFWIPDSLKSRLEFMRQHQMKFNDFQNEVDFADEMLQRNMINSSDYFNDFKNLKMNNTTLVWKTLPKRFHVKTNISDIFNSNKGHLMRSYQISSLNLYNAYKAFMFYTDSLESSICMRMITHHNTHFEKIKNVRQNIDNIMKLRVTNRP